LGLRRQLRTPIDGPLARIFPPSVHYFGAPEAYIVDVPPERSMEEAMLKVSLLAALLAIGTSPAYAAQDLCNDAHMRQMDQMIEQMTDAAKQQEATEALDKSKAAMKAGDNAECMKYMDEAHKAMGL
jgi:hypothetical protein